MTDLLRNAPSLAALRPQLAGRGIDVDTCLLAGMVDTEEMTSFGALVGDNGEIWYFETDSEQTIEHWERVDDPTTLADSFRAVEVAVEVVARPRG